MGLIRVVLGVMLVRLLSTLIRRLIVWRVVILFRCRRLWDSVVWLLLFVRMTRCGRLVRLSRLIATWLSRWVVRNSALVLFVFR